MFPQRVKIQISELSPPNSDILPTRMDQNILLSRYVAKQDAPEKEGNVPHNSCKTNLIAID